MDQDRIDFWALDPTADDAERERIVMAILARCAPELARRAGREPPLVLLARWARPALTAAAILAIAASSALFVSRERGAPVAALPPGISDELALPDAAEASMVTDQTPSVSDVVFALERGQR